MRRAPRLAAVVVVAVLAPALTWAKCPPDSVEVGPTCVDKYEASIWQIPADASALLKRVKKGVAKREELVAAGATQRGAAVTNACTSLEYPATFPPNGNWTEPLYAVSLPNVLPSTCAR